MSKTTSSQHHHGSHRHLLQQVTGFPADVDAIIVPTARNVATLKPAVELAEIQLLVGAVATVAGVHNGRPV